MHPARRPADVHRLLEKIPAEAGDIPEFVVARLRPYARVVALSRQDDAHPGRWVYLERLWAEAFSLDAVIQRYGGGAYRAKILGPWDPGRRREMYLTQVPFAIDARYPPTALTAAKMRRA